MTQSPSEQSEIAKQIMEIENCTYSHNLQKLSEIVESFFSIIHQRLVDNNIQLNKYVIIEEIDGDHASHHYYVNELVDFFNLQQLIVPDSNNMHGQVRPFDLNQAESV